ncbi:Putative ribosome biogenesis GTPase RsgA [Poriferisphaera corsica]|uniref:Small ribosomal subunit biogenesis GTPase RsgA n=1 Tax=Poriferisphaera corsica TaxID=2528020 RepID=A0A517YS15_9BACT|nr:ribosome small subunit-dependent GTPase A [Poriferisphaera corsica]QDU33006.1 Putative ribosome biogenesis GTPase RsgA [Poriferisphaera corsica]
MSHIELLTRLGWDDHFAGEAERLGFDMAEIARVSGVRRKGFVVRRGDESWMVKAAGRLKRAKFYPVAGDWVVVNQKNVITDVLPRRNALSRGAAGVSRKEGGPAVEEQVMASNLDAVLIVCGLDGDFNLRRIERYQTLIYNCELKAVIVLTKADLQAKRDEMVKEVMDVVGGTGGVEVHVVGMDDEVGMDGVRRHLNAGETITMIGSSGAGKSTLINRLLGEELQVTGAVSDAVGKGKHTTTKRDLIMMPNGGMVIDNPGIREVAFWGDEGGVDATFPEIDDVAGMCKFGDCSHTHEPGCAVRAGVESGEIKQERLESYLKMRGEMSRLAERQEKGVNRAEKERLKGLSIKIRDVQMRKGGKRR